MLTRSTEIRKLPPSHVQELSTILENGESWKRLMATIPSILEKDSFACDVRPTNLPKYHTEQFKQIEAGSEMSRRKCTEILLDEWGTSGRVRPSVGHLLHLLTRAGLFRAADYVAVEILGEQRPPRPSRGPAAAIQTVLPPLESPPIDDRLKEVLDARIHRQIEIIKERAPPETKTPPTTPQTPPPVPPQIIVTELPNEATPSTFTMPLVVQFEKHSLEMSDVEDLPHISVLLNDNNSSESGGNNVPSSSSPNLDFLLQDSSSSISESSISNQHVSPEHTVTSDNSEFRPDISFLIGPEHLERQSPLPQLSLNTTLPCFPYDELERTTNAFDERPFEGDAENGRFLGSGAFGSVFLAMGLLDGGPVAVKRLNLEEGVEVQEGDLVTNQFRHEVEVLSRHRHGNLLPLLGYSCDGPTYCLVYEYAAGGALETRLRASPRFPPLPWQRRIRVALGAARALAFLHAAPLVHRDVKSANILLDAADEPRLSDFGVAALLPGQAAFGTAAYMAPEAHAGHVSDRLDVFAFGVVLLELLTGLPPVDEDRVDIVTVVEDKCEDKDISSLLDSSVGSWMEGEVVFSEKVATIAFDCIEYDRNRRPAMADVEKLLEDLVERLS